MIVSLKQALKLRLQIVFDELSVMDFIKNRDFLDAIFFLKHVNEFVYYCKLQYLKNYYVKS